MTTNTNDVVGLLREHRAQDAEAKAKSLAHDRKEERLGLGVNFLKIAAGTIMNYKDPMGTVKGLIGLSGLGIKALFNYAAESDARPSKPVPAGPSLTMAP